MDFKKFSCSTEMQILVLLILALLWERVCKSFWTESQLFFNRFPRSIQREADVHRTIKWKENHLHTPKVYIAMVQPMSLNTWPNWRDVDNSTDKTYHMYKFVTLILVYQFEPQLTHQFHFHGKYNVENLN